MSKAGVARREVELAVIIEAAEKEAAAWSGSSHVMWEHLFALHALLDWQRKPHLCVTAEEMAPLMERAEKAWARLHPGADRTSTTLAGI